MKDKTTLSILGCGWLGHPLAKHFIQKGFKVLGSTTQKEKVPLLKSDKITPFLFDFNQPLPKSSPLLLSDFFILNIPPSKIDHYPQKLASLLEHISQPILFVSSTGVFSHDQGEVDEDTPPRPDNPRGQMLLKLEEIVKQKKAHDSIILRPGGLIGPGRNPARSLAGKTNLSRGDAPANLVHLLDLINLIEHILSTSRPLPVYHAVCPDHTPKQKLYSNVCHKLKLSPPQYTDMRKGKIISHSQMDQILKGQWHCSQLDDFLTQS